MNKYIRRMKDILELSSNTIVSPLTPSIYSYLIIFASSAVKRRTTLYTANKIYISPLQETSVNCVSRTFRSIYQDLHENNYISKNYSRQISMIMQSIPIAISLTTELKVELCNRVKVRPISPKLIVSKFSRVCFLNYIEIRSSGRLHLTPRRKFSPEHPLMLNKVDLIEDDNFMLSSHSTLQWMQMKIRTLKLVEIFSCNSVF